MNSHLLTVGGFAPASTRTESELSALNTKTAPKR
jgi:hypothetical protein